MNSSSSVTRRASAIQLSFATDVRELCDRLREKGTTEAIELLRDGRALAITFDSWARRGNPPPDSRNVTYAHALTWCGAAREELARVL